MILLFITLSKASSGMSIIEPKKGFEAALQTKISIFPNCALVSSTSICSAVLSEILQGITIAPPSVSLQASFISSATISHASTFLLDTTTFAP